VKIHTRTAFQFPQRGFRIALYTVDRTVPAFRDETLFAPDPAFRYPRNPVRIVCADWREDFRCPLIYSTRTPVSIRNGTRN